MKELMKLLMLVVVTLAAASELFAESPTDWPAVSRSV